MHSLFSGDLDAGLGAAADLGADVVADCDSYMFIDYHLSGYGIKRLNRSCLALPYPRWYVS